MKLNCKQGDLAVIVRSAAGNEGRLVQCLRLVVGHEELTPGGTLLRTPAWETDTDLRGCHGRVDRYVADAQLRPLRDSDGEDEMLQLVGRPVGEPQAA